MEKTVVPRTSETLATGRFACFACGAWGYLEEAVSSGATSSSATTRAGSLHRASLAR